MNQKIKRYIDNCTAENIIKSLADVQASPAYDKDTLIGVNTMPWTGRGYTSHYNWNINRYDFYMDDDYIYYDETDQSWKTQDGPVTSEIAAAIDRNIRPMVYVTRFYSGRLPNGKRLIEDIDMCNEIDDAETWDIVKSIVPMLSYDD